MRHGKDHGSTVRLRLQDETPLHASRGRQGLGRRRLDVPLWLRLRDHGRRGMDHDLVLPTPSRFGTAERNDRIAHGRRADIDDLLLLKRGV